MVMPDFLWILPHVPSPFADSFVLYPFDIISLSHESDYMVSPVITSRESANLEVVLRTPNQLILIIYIYLNINCN